MGERIHSQELQNVNPGTVAYATEADRIRVGNVVAPGIMDAAPELMPRYVGKERFMVSQCIGLADEQGPFIRLVTQNVDNIRQTIVADFRPGERVIRIVAEHEAL